MAAAAAQHNGAGGHVLTYRNVSPGRRDVKLSTCRHGLSVRPATLMRMCSRPSSESRRRRAVGTRLKSSGRQKGLYAAAAHDIALKFQQELFHRVQASAQHRVNQHAPAQRWAAGKNMDTLIENSCFDAMPWGLRLSFSGPTFHTP